MIDDHRLEPWMLRADWREDRRNWLWIDRRAWPAGPLVETLPPVPIIVVGGSLAGADMSIEDGFSLKRVAMAIEQAPLASAALVDLLRATKGMTAEQALVAESLAYGMLQGGAEHRRWREARAVGAMPGDAALPGHVRTERSGSRLRLTLARPAARNAIDRAMRDLLFEAFSVAAADETISRIDLRAEGRAFSVGADLGEFGTTGDPPLAHAIRMRTLPAWPLLSRPDLLAAHVQGGCIGAGLELAAFAGRLTAAPDAWFQLPEAAMGLMPGFGGTVSIPRRIGRQRAALLMLSGRRISARTALDWGLVDAIVDETAADNRRADALAR